MIIIDLAFPVILLKNQSGENFFNSFSFIQNWNIIRFAAGVLNSNFSTNCSYPIIFKRNCSFWRFLLLSTRVLFIYLFLIAVITCILWFFNNYVFFFVFFSKSWKSKKFFKWALEGFFGTIVKLFQKQYWNMDNIAYQGFPTTLPWAWELPVIWIVNFP